MKTVLPIVHALMPDTGTDVGPHEFHPIAYIDRLRARGRCRACYCTKATHPMTGWTTSRWIGDRSPASIHLVWR